MTKSDKSEIEDLKRQLQNVKKELRLVNHQLQTGSNRLRDTKRISKLRSRPHLIISPAHTFPPRLRIESHKRTSRSGPAVGSAWENTLRSQQEDWQIKVSKNATVTDFCDRIQLKSKMAVRLGGAKLVPLDGTRPVGQQELSWNGWNYISCIGGDFIRTGVREDAVEQCRYFTRQGICGKMNNCPFEHNVDRISLCRQYVAGECGGECLFSHKPNAYNTPICRYAFEDTCGNPKCMYSHRLPNHSKDPRYEIWTCRPFALGGWCGRGFSCPFAHLYNCPDYEENGTCPRGKSCTLQHTATKRIQKLAAMPLEERGVFCSNENEEPEKIIVSSFTVDPKTLFIEHSQTSSSLSATSATEFVIDVELDDPMP